MTLKSPEASTEFSPEDTEEFEKILTAYATLNSDYTERFNALSEDMKAKYVRWKIIQDDEVMLRHQSPPLVFTRTNRPEELLKAAAGVEIVDNNDNPAKFKKTKCCAIL